MIKKRLLTTLFVIFLALTVALVSATVDSNKAKADHIVTLTIEVNGDGYTDPPTGQYVIDFEDSMVTITS